MSAPLRIDLRESSGIDAKTRHAVEEVFSEAFQVEADARECLAPYFCKVMGILLAWRGERLVGFQFYQVVTDPEEGFPVHHFSLSAKRPGTEGGGLQKRFGRLVMRRHFLSTPPWHPVWLAGTTNNARSYANMHAAGGTIFPDILAPQAPNPFGRRYRRIAAQLGMEPLDERGLLPNRMQGLGFGLAASPENRHPMGAAYSNYVGHDLRHGVFVLVKLTPWIDVPRHAVRSLLGGVWRIPRGGP